MSETATPVQRKKRRGLWWKILIVVVALPVLFVFVGPVIQKSILQSTVPKEIQSAFEENHTSYTSDHQHWRSETSTVLGLGEPTYSVAYDLCYLAHNDAGWMVHEYTMNCLLSYVDVYELPAQNDIVDAAVNRAIAELRIKATIWVRDYLRAADLPVPDIRDDTVPAIMWASLPGTTDVSALIDAEVVADLVVLYAMHDAFDARHRIAETGTTTLDSAKQYLIVGDTRPYYYRSLGCKLGRIFCASPLGDS